MNVVLPEKPPDFERRFSDVPRTVEDYLNIKDSLTKEKCWYLIGKFFEREKYNRAEGESIQKLGDRLGRQFGYAKNTMRRLVCYYKGIDYLRTVVPDSVPDILAGKIKISSENLCILARKAQEEIPLVLERIQSGSETVCSIFPERNKKTEIKARRGYRAAVSAASKDVTVKDMPEYDPDAQVAALAYTVPTWVNAIERVFFGEYINDVTKKARLKLISELSILRDGADMLCELLLETNQQEEKPYEQ